ncbi:4-hydroxyphenylacetate 3-hydroxylase family protein [Peribacillus glennii]|uniref:4-hydroxyphenylacetate 3-hydroxylase n=1 Tax=Peribacillus glennii TaxID=2303991 RepID=A0A372LH54_9BACI|nr:4-hydroxyphenylacetate 3-hydroxylase N-terminal domain-containing protein [Peribacillus glennii]RFU64946.1 4-hydroxyphenylacetate 3-hydroxylase [Peribacillus glennii]
MVRTGAKYLEAIKDNRNIYIGGERVEDVTTHPAFKGISQTIAGLYDISCDEQEKMTYITEEGTIANKIYMIPKSLDELRERREAIQKWAKATCGFVGRSPDHVAGFLAGFMSKPEVFARGGERFKENVINFYKHARDNDLYLSYVIIPPQTDRSKASHEQENKYTAVGVYEEKENGIIVRGSQMLGTGSAVSDYIFVSCITPLRPGDEDHALSFVVPLNAPGLKLYSRPSFAADKPSSYDYPLSTKFDESDALVVFDDVFIPWEHVFVYRNIDLVRAQFHETPAHIYGNSQAQIRFVTKLKFILGIARKVASMNGIDKFPQVQEKLGELAAVVASIEGMLLASEYEYMTDENGTVYPNRRFLYGVVGQQDTIYPKVIHMVRDLVGGGVLQVPASYKDMINPETRDDINRYIKSSGVTAEERVKLFKLAWDVIGSEFGGRHQQYELFYNGAPFVTKGYSFRNYRFDEAIQMVDQFMESYQMPQTVKEQVL